ncbi:MAG: hypothetical protein IPP72_04185 [Chitinophagaceae bacterium]|nr:hypothetical protein [Chitinophagaceae bacterium]
MQTETNTAVKAGTGAEKLYDLCMIEKLCRGNQEQVKQMIQVFIDQTPQAVEEIRLAYKKNDFTVVKKTAHRIKPVLSYYAIVKIEKDIQLIEVMAEEGIATHELELKIKKVEDVVSRIVEQMKSTFLS